ncbi:hypothetical protein [Azospirillum doebereinerae]
MPLDRLALLGQTGATFLARNRPLMLLITHISENEGRTENDVGQACHTTP